MNSIYNNKGIKQVTKIIFIILITIITAYACTQNKNIDFTIHKQNKINIKKAAERSPEIVKLKARLKDLMNPHLYVYNPIGKPDPFHPFWNIGLVQVKTPNISNNKNDNCSTSLACMDVGQLTLVGVILPKHGRPLAMVQDAAGFGYIVHIGTRIGTHDGRVYRILPDRIIVREKIRNLSGKFVYKNTVMLLHPEGEQ